MDQEDRNRWADVLDKFAEQAEAHGDDERVEKLASEAKSWRAGKPKSSGS